jgi:DNA invertase Pin-like site-specific DNA recombinase
MDALPRRLVAYYRVSTRQQGDSGLGLDGQVEAGERFAVLAGAELVNAFREVESGKRADRPELARALAFARRAGATLVIAKLDRLARNVHFLSGLMESGVEFVACDNPTANRLTVHILAAVAEDEARRISERTKAALAAYKARGGKLGAARPECRKLTPELAATGRRAGARTNRDAAAAAYADLAPLMARLRAEGKSLRQIAVALNAEGHATRQGKPWGPMQVRRALTRA